MKAAVPAGEDPSLFSEAGRERDGRVGESPAPKSTATVARRPAVMVAGVAATHGLTGYVSGFTTPRSIGPAARGGPTVFRAPT